MPRTPKCSCGECQWCRKKQYMREYYLAHADEERDRARARRRATFLENPERIREEQRQWRIANPERARERDRAHYAATAEQHRRTQRERRSENPEPHRDANREYRHRFPERELARKAVALAIQKGLLVRQPCCVCGDPLSHAHHVDYTRPLDINWLCPKHHGEMHRIREEAA